MDDTLLPLVLDFLDWIDERPRSHAEAMDVWRTSCPRLAVWEDALETGLAARRHAGSTEIVVITPAGRALLARHRPQNAPPPAPDTMAERLA